MGWAIWGKILNESTHNNCTGKQDKVSHEKENLMFSCSIDYFILGIPNNFDCLIII